MADKKPTGIQKITSLLSSMGISEDAVKEFAVTLESWHKDEKNKLQAEYSARLEKAKKICVEEVEAHKSSLSRGVQMFLESKQEQISKAAEKTAAIAESEAVSQLKKVSNLLKGLDIDSAANAQALQAESEKSAKLAKRLATLEESLQREKAKGAKMADLAEKSIERQKQLEKSLTESKQVLEEAKKRLTVKETISEHKVKTAKPKTKTKTVVENKKSISQHNDIDQIAETL
jgi:hypothetical protein